MTRQRVEALMYLIQTLEPSYMRTSTEDAADIQITVWYRMLEPVDAAWTKRSIEAYYAKGHHRLTCGMLRAEWDRLTEESERVARAREPVRVGGDDLLRESPPWVRPYLAYCTEHVEERRSPQADRPWIEAWCREHGEPLPHWEETARDIEERHCGVRDCRCRHVACRGGFMDEEQPNPDPEKGWRYPQV